MYFSASPRHFALVSNAFSISHRCPVSSPISPAGVKSNFMYSLHSIQVDPADATDANPPSTATAITSLDHSMGTSTLPAGRITPPNLPPSPSAPSPASPRYSRHFLGGCSRLDGGDHFLTPLLASHSSPPIRLTMYPYRRVGY